MTEIIEQAPTEQAAPTAAPAPVATQTDHAAHGAAPATLDVLMKKPRRVVRATMAVPGDDDTVNLVQLKFQALTASEFDDLVAKYPPSGKDKTNGASWDNIKFPVALIAESCIQPKMSYDQVMSVYNNPDWASGEFNDLFVAAMRATQGGLDIPFSVRD